MTTNNVQQKTPEKKKKNSYAPLWALIALSALPYIVGTIYYQFRDQLPLTSGSNYGLLIEPARELKSTSMTLLDGSNRDITSYQKKWLMLYMLDGECDKNCLQNLYFMRQVRKAMAGDRYRINRLLLVENDNVISDDLLKQLKDFPGMHVATIDNKNKDSFYSTIGGLSGNIFNKVMLVDPFGNYMMEYPSKPDPERLLKDVKRLLSISRIG